MRGRPGPWSLAVLVSAMAHGIMLAVLAVAVDPAPMAPQASVQARLVIAAQTVEREAVPPATPATDRPDAFPPESLRMDGAAVPVSRANPAPPPAPDAMVLLPEGMAITAAGDVASAAPAAAAVPVPGEALGPVGSAAVAGTHAAPARPVSERARAAQPILDPVAPTIQSGSGQARPVDPLPSRARAGAEDATQAVSVAPGARAAKPASAPGVLVAAETPSARPVDVVALPRAAPAAVALPRAAPATVTAPTGFPVAAASVAGQAAVVASRVPEGVAASAATVAPGAGVAIALVGPDDPASRPERLPTVAAAAADAAQTADAAPPVAGSGEALGARAPGGTALPQRGPGTLADAAVPATPDTARVTAALAWSAQGGDGTIDPLSLAAIQSFLRPGDPGRGETSVRDGIAGVLAAVPCARLQTTFRPGSGALELRGHIPEEGLRAPVLAALRAEVGGSIPLADNMLVLPRPTCGALSGIASVGLAQSREQARDPRIVGPAAHARVYNFVDGDRLSFELTGPDYPAYFYIDYFDADGMVLHLQPNEIVPLARIGAKERLVVGRGADGQPALDIRVGPPFGQEIMVAFATSVPLFDGLRPVRERAGPYLDALRARVAEARAASDDFKGEWVYFFVSTRAR